jgi:rhodanese-related sulfurtransferase
MSPGAVPQRSSAGSDVLIELVPIEDDLLAMRQGRRIVFVDAREPPEFTEERIPGAVNMPLRAVPGAELAVYADADLVIPNCLKDFRGFEVAKALQNRGLRNVRLLQRPGLNGWKGSGLPTTGALPRRTDDEAQEALAACAQNQQCLNGTSK